MTKPRHPTDSSRSKEHDRPPALDLACAAFQATAPSDMEVQRAVGRLKVRLEQRPGRRVRPAPFLAAALVGVGALAYAASALNEPAAPVPDAPEPSQVRGAPLVGENPNRAAEAARESTLSTTAVPQKPASSELSSAAERAGDAPHGERAAAAREARARARTSTMQSAKRVKRAVPHADSASWGEVSRAMAAKDFARAEQALAALARQGDATTRANARLGQAQLALGRGDCARARALAAEVQASGANAATERRAEDIVARCAAERQ